MKRYLQLHSCSPTRLFASVRFASVRSLAYSLACSLMCSLVCCSLSLAQDANPTDIVVADFETDSYGDWKVTGEAFGAGPARGTLPGQMNVEGYQGERLVNSFHNGDGTTGTLTSPEFKIERKHIGFLIGGGKNESQLTLQLLIDGKTVRSETGLNDQQGGSENLEQASWEVSEYLGKSATIQITDVATGGWGHINVDQIVQTDSRPSGPIKNAERTIPAESQYLNFPIRNGAPKRKVTLLVDGKVAVINDMELAGDQVNDPENDQVDWWAPMDISQWQGRTLTVRVDRLADKSLSLNLIDQTAQIKNADDLYDEAKRGQFHFSPRRGWNNDPNGMVFYKGEYHLFFQHNPYGWGWGNMHWGHAVSKDMVHWKELRDELLPDEMGPMFSGSAVVDWNNTSGFGTKENPPLVLIYTAAGNPTVQAIAYSTDGRNFTKYDGNPVVPQVTGGNRDPKVMWYEPTQQWVMVLYVELPGKHTIHFFTSPDLKDWKLASINEGDAPGGRYLFECPDFFQLSVDGDSNRKKWVLLAADSQYAIGSFDGQNFTPEFERLVGHRGRGFYAPQTFSDIPEADGRRIQIGWWQTETKGMSFNQSMTIPLELRLTETSDGPRMTFTPVKELQSLRSRSYRLGQMKLKEGDENPLAKIASELVEIRIEFDAQDSKEVTFNIRDVMISYFPDKQQLRVDDRMVDAPFCKDGKQRLTIYCDRTGVEVFASDGLCYVPLPFMTNPENKKLFLEVKGGTAEIQSLDVYELRSSWNP